MAEQQRTVGKRARLLTPVFAVAVVLVLALSSTPARADAQASSVGAAANDQTPPRAHTKVETPTVDKLVGEVAADGSASWQKAADAQIGAWVPYRLTGTLPSTWEKFTTYHYAFVDQLDPELEADPAGVVVELLAEDGSVARTITSGFTVAYANNRLTVTTTDLKALAPEATAAYKVRVSYNARLVPGKAQAGAANPADNYVYLEYTEKSDASGLGRTPESRARLLTWSLELDKVARSGDKKLAGARFTLQAANGSYVQADGMLGAEAHEFVSGDDGTATVTGLDAGAYTLAEVGAPAGYSQLEEPIALTITSELDQESARLGAATDDSHASVTSADAETGTVSVRVANDLAGIFGRLPQTGDVVSFLAIFAVAAAGVLLVAAGVRRKGRER